MDGMIEVSSTVPAIEKKATTERRIEIEMADGLRRLDPARHVQI
jgi:hypothetical protein